MEGADAAAHDSLDFCASGIALLATGKTHQLDYHFLTDDKLQALPKIVDLISNQNMCWVFLFFLHSDWLFMLAYCLLYLIFTAAYFEVYVGKFVLKGV